VIPLYFDDDIGITVVIRALRERGCDAVSSFTAGTFGRTDEEHVRFATAAGRVCCTGNKKDYARIHNNFATRGERHSGILVIPQQKWGIGELIRRLLAFASTTSAEHASGQLFYLSSWAPPRA
jgi:hypothetical protein